MKFWKRRRPVDLVESQLQAVSEREGPSDEIHDLAMDKIIASMNEYIKPVGKTSLRDKITMTRIRG